MKIDFLSFDEIVAIHTHQMNVYGGLSGMRDYKLLDSALRYPEAMFEGQYLHPNIYHMAAAYMYAIIKNHPFLDGNKRTAIATTLLFLKRNDFQIDATTDELFNLAIETAASKNSEINIALFFEKKSIKN